MADKFTPKKYAYAKGALNVVSRWMNGEEVPTYPRSALQLAPFEANARKIADLVGGDVGKFYLSVADAVHTIRAKLSEIAKEYGIHTSYKRGEGTQQSLPDEAVNKFLNSTEVQTAYNALRQLAEIEPQYASVLRERRKVVGRELKAMEMD